MPVVVATVQQTDHDAYEWSGDSNVYGIPAHADGSTWFGGTDLVSDWNYPGWIFELAIPQGATIASAVLELWADRAGVGNPSALHFAFRALAVDDAQPWSDAVSPRDGARTAVGVDWDPQAFLSLAGYTAVADLAPVVQAIVGRTGWASGNRIAIVLDDDGSAAGPFQSVHEFSGNPARAARLTVDFEEPAGPQIDATTSADATADLRTAAAKTAPAATATAARAEDATQAMTIRPAVSSDAASADARTQATTTRPASTADAAAARTAAQATAVRSAATSATAAAEVRTVATTAQVRSASTREVAAAAMQTEASKQAAAATRDAGAARAGTAATTVREARLEVLAVCRVLHQATTTRMAVSVVEAVAGTLSVATTVRAEPDEENIYPAARLVRSFAAAQAVRVFPAARGRRTFEVR